MYTIFERAVPSSRLGPWEKPLGRFREVLGHTAMGTFFLRDPDDGACIALYPLRAGNNASGIGQFSDGAQLEREILGDAEMRDELCQPAAVAELEARLGALKANEVYFPVPYPCLGGSGALSTYDKGDVWVFAHLLGQALGVDGSDDEDDDDDEEPDPGFQQQPRPSAATAAVRKNWKRDPNVWTLIVVFGGLLAFVLVRWIAG